MNLPWDKSWFKLSFYAIFTFICIYIAKYVIDTLAYALVNMAGIYTVALNIAVKAFSVFSVMIGGFVIAYVLSPVADTVQHKLKVGRTCAVVMTYAGVLLIFILLGSICVISADPGKEGYMKGLARQMEIYAENINKFRQRADTFFGSIGMDLISENIDKGILSLKGIAGEIGANAFGYLRNIGSKAVTVLLSILVSFYFIKDKHEILIKLKKYSRAILPEGLYFHLTAFVRDIDTVLSGYVRGQLTDAVIMSSLLSLGLAIVRIPFAVIIGVLSGFLNIIPYFGCLLGLVLAVLMALLSGRPVRALYAVLVIGILQQIDAAFIVPKVVGDNVKLRPLVIIISLAVAGRLFGLWGLVFAVPTVAVIKLKFDRYCERKIKE